MAPVGPVGPCVPCGPASPCGPTIGPMFSHNCVPVFQKYTSPSEVLIQPWPASPYPTVDVVTELVLPIRTILTP